MIYRMKYICQILKDINIKILALSSKFYGFQFFEIFQHLLSKNDL